MKWWERSWEDSLEARVVRATRDSFVCRDFSEQERRRYIEIVSKIEERLVALRRDYLIRATYPRLSVVVRLEEALP